MFRRQSVNGRHPTGTGYVCPPEMWIARANVGVLVSLQQVANDMNKMKRLLFQFFVVFSSRTLQSLQVTSFKGRSDIGSLLQTLHRTTTSFGKHTIREQPLGSSRATYQRNGKRWDHCYGFTGNVNILISRPVPYADRLPTSWLREKYSSVRSASPSMLGLFTDPN